MKFYPVRRLTRETLGGFKADLFVNTQNEMLVDSA